MWQAHLLQDGGPLHPFHAVVLRLKTADETVRGHDCSVFMAARDHAFVSTALSECLASLRLGLPWSLCLLQVIAPALNELSANMADTLSIGSYPVSAQRDGAGIVISLEGALHKHLLPDTMSHLWHPCPSESLPGETDVSMFTTEGMGYKQAQLLA